VSRIYAISGFQSYDVPHWGVAYIEADDPEAAKQRLLELLTTEEHDTVWGWGDAEPAEYKNPANWRVSEAERPFAFILGGGCR
jgi:hypothetical protein